MKKLEVEHFLKKMNEKLLIGEIIYAYRNERGKNQDTLLQLNLIPKQRDNIIKKLESDDFCECIEDQFGNNPLLVFGKTLKRKEIYIKIQLKKLDVFCISFHIAVHEMKYKFK